MLIKLNVFAFSFKYFEVKDVTENKYYQSEATI